MTVVSLRRPAILYRFEAEQAELWDLRIKVLEL
jgi:hypothetical protein